MKILMKNSYLVYEDELRDELMQKVKEENSRMLSGEKFPMSQIFVTSAEDEVLFMIMEFRNSIKENKELTKEFFEKTEDSPNFYTVKAE